jgi:hypothetical protein
LVFTVACNRSYLAPGLRGDFDLSGSYVVEAQSMTSGCRNSVDVHTRSRADVQHSPREMQLTLVFEGDAYDVALQRNGKFASAPVRRERGTAVETATMRGRFGDSTFTASLEVNRNAVRPILPTTQNRLERSCRYHVNISGTRIANAY